jgi:carboxylesterase type B
MGVMHGDEIEYVFGHPLNMSIDFSQKERELSRRIMDIFARFALTGWVHNIFSLHVNTIYSKNQNCHA